MLLFCNKYPDAATALQRWYHELIKCSFNNFNELKQKYGYASIVGDDRVVFNIMGNKYRLIVRIVIEYKAVQIKWFGTHKEYDNIDVSTIQKNNTMKLQVIKTQNEYLECLSWVDNMFDKKVSPDSAEGEKLQVALLLTKQYEDIHFPIPFPDPNDANKAKMEEKGLRTKDLIGIIGSKGYISALLNKRKPLNLELAKIFHQELGKPAEVFLS